MAQLTKNPTVSGTTTKDKSLIRKTVSDLSRDYSNLLQVTTDYQSFSFMETNRKVSKLKVEKLALAVEDYPLLLLAQPVIVNEKKQIIDGQHHFSVAKALGRPFSYVVIPESGIELARIMNTRHTLWVPNDFAHSYAAEGREAYKTFVELLGKYRVSNYTLIIYLTQSRSHGIVAKFKRGDFTIPDLETSVQYLDRLDDLADIIGRTRGKWLPTNLNVAFFIAFRLNQFDYDHFVKRLKENISSWAVQGSPENYCRQIEDIYNKGQITNKIRLF